MTLKAWREIAKPHRDVLEGSFKQSEFAADISQVHAGIAPVEYGDAEKFFRRTFITEGMRLLLISVAKRLVGQGGDPVIQLQTAFGGGKTHTLLAVYHLAKRKVDTSKLEGIPPILDEAGILTLPTANVAVIDGIRLSPSQPRKYGSLVVNTLWGELAWQLLGKAGYDLVSEADKTGTSPGKETLAELIQKAAPCVILVDELLAFIRQLEAGKSYAAGTFDSNISFLQALTEAIKSVPNAILLASLPESEVEVGGTMGQLALNTLEKYFARIESVWKPVATEEAFEIVRRRLFDTIGDSRELDQVCRGFAEFYRSHSDQFPAETQSSHYYDRITKSYPIHPEIFDRLYEDWSTLEKFQRTRGVLQYMAIVIHRLWNSDNRDPLIMPGSIPLDDANVRHKSIHYLPQGWEPVIEKEIDGQRSGPYEIDGHDTRFGAIQAARRTARTIFFGSASSSGEQMIRGIKMERILLGAALPGQTIGIYEDVLKRLRDRLHYLYSDQDRLWFDTKPNLRREMESRKQTFNLNEEVLPLLKEYVSKLFTRDSAFAGIHVFTPSGDVPDEFGSAPRLVVLSPASAYSRAHSEIVLSAAEEILRQHGDQPRKKQNRVIFLAADNDMVTRLKDQARTYLAWKSIVEDIEEEKLNLDLFQSKQARQYKEDAEQALKQFSRQTYKWLLCPAEEFVKGKPTLRWDIEAISPTAKALADEIFNKLKEQEWLITDWSPIHLKELLTQWYFKDGVTDIGVLNVWQDSCSFLYLPRLINDEIFKSAVKKGFESEDYFGFANGKEGDKYLGFLFGNSGSVNLDSASILIERQRAREYKAQIEPTPPAAEEQDTVPSATLAGTAGGGQSASQVAATGNHQSAAVKPKDQFYGTVNLTPVTAKLDFATIVDEVIQQFTSRIGVDVNIFVEIQAHSRSGFDDGTQRNIKENCKVLKFTKAEFESE